MSFTVPVALLLLLVLPVVMLLGWPRYAYRRGRDVVSLLLRLLILTMLILALAGFQLVQAADKLAVVFLLDVSDSVGRAAQEQAIAYVELAMAEKGPDDLAGVVVFGANAAVERQISAVRELGPVRSVPLTSNTDFAEAIRLALALFPPDTARRIVILSDGQPTVGNTEAAAQLAAAAGVEISYVQVERETTPEVQVSEVRVPNAVSAGQDFDLSVTVDSEVATPAMITVTQRGAVIYREQVDLELGTNTYSLSLTATGAGFRDFRVQVEPEGADGFFQNNQLSAFSQVVGPPSVLIVSSDPSESQYLADALTESGLTVDVVGPNDLPIGVAPLVQYSSIILTNVRGPELSKRRMEILQAYVRDLGGGLVVVGGPDSFGPGGYFQTPLEEALPVQMQLTDQQRVPQLTLAYLIDRSGSMTAVGPSGVENLELAKEAIIRSIDFLQPTDRAGVISFDTGGTWLAQVQPVLDRTALQTLVGTLRAGGGTDILAGMTSVSEVLMTDPSPRKHIILLTDGGADPTGLIELTGELYDQYDVTTSVIAIGAGSPSQTFLDEMAEAGGGNFHAVDVVESIPTIFTLETVLATRSYIFEDPFLPQIVSSTSPIVDGITTAPELLGYVATSAKQTAQVILVGPPEHNDPLLAAWQYGLGRSVAFTSDATARWGANWIGWDEYARFWNQTVRWTMTEGTNDNLETRVVMEGEQARVVVDARDADGQFLNGLSLSTSLIRPETDNNREGESLPLRQVAPGRYEAVFTPDGEGAYFMTVNGQGGGGDDAAGAVQVNQRTGWVMSYSPEYSVQSRSADASLLQDIATLTNGRSLADATDAVFAHNLEFKTASTPLWPPLLVAALLLLPLDIAVRRLIITRSDLARARAAVSRGRAVAEAPSERLAGLMGAKARAQQKAQEAGDTSASPSAPASTVSALRSQWESMRDTTRDSTRDTTRDMTARTTRMEPPPVTTTSAAPSASASTSPAPASGGDAAGEDANIAGKLLQKRRQRE